MLKDWEALELKPGRYAIRPRGTAGTCGWIDGVAWTVHYVNAGSQREAMQRFGEVSPYLRRAQGRIACQH